jgi:hypothetical protein
LHFLFVGADPYPKAIVRLSVFVTDQSIVRLDHLQVAKRFRRSLVDLPFFKDLHDITNCSDAAHGRGFEFTGLCHFRTFP